MSRRWVPEARAQSQASGERGELCRQSQGGLLGRTVPFMNLDIHIHVYIYTYTSYTYIYIYIHTLEF